MIKKKSALLLLILSFLSCLNRVQQVIDKEALTSDLISSFHNAVIKDSNFNRKYKDLINYKKLFKDPWSYNSPRLVMVGFEIDKKKMFQNMRRSIYLSAYKGSPCKVSIPIDISTGCDSFFSFSFAGLSIESGENAGDLIIKIVDGDRSFFLYSTKNSDEAFPGNRWIDICIDLPEEYFTTPYIEISFKANSSNPQHIFIANPRIFIRKKEQTSFTNVIFICVDALRADVVDSILKKYNITPKIDSLAKDGMAFTNHFIVSNWTRPSTISMFTSSYASDTGVNLYYPPVSDEEKEFFYRKSGIKPITSILREKGYITRSIGNNSFMLDYNGIGIDLNFDNLSEYETQWEDTIDITNEVIEWLKNNSRRKFFLFINYNAPHSAYIPPEQYLNPLKRRYKYMHPWFRSYLGEVAFTDHYIGLVVKELKRLNLYNNTIIIVTSDHGEIFSREHEYSPFTDARALYSHGQTQLDEELRTPLIIKPDIKSNLRNKKTDVLVRSIDIAPTILDLLDIPQPVKYKGKTLLSVIRGEERKDRILYSEGRMMYSVRAHGYKYAERFYGFGLRPSHWGGDEVIEYRELFDLKKDPNELENIVDKKKQITMKMQDLLHKMRFEQTQNILTSKGVKVGGIIKVYNGFFYDVRTNGKGSELEKISRKEYYFNLLPGNSIIYQTIPKEAKTALYTDKKIKLFSGRYLLPVISSSINGPYLIDPSNKIFHYKPCDNIISFINKGLLYWNIPQKSGIREIKKTRFLSRDINRLLQKWGYIQGKEKKLN